MSIVSIPDQSPFRSSSIKIKPILRKESRSIITPKDLKITIKQGIKVINLDFTNKDDKTKDLKISKHHSLINKLTRYWKNLSGVQVGSLCPKDIKSLLKIQRSTRSLSSLQIGKINLADFNAYQGIQRLLVRCKYLKKYTSESEVELFRRASQGMGNYRNSVNLGNRNIYNRNNTNRAKEMIPLRFHSKKSTPRNDFKKTQKLMLGLRKYLPFIASIEENQSSFMLLVNLPFNTSKKEFDKEILGVIRRFKSQYYSNLETLTASLPVEKGKIFSFLEENGLHMISQLDFNSNFEKEKAVERTFSRKDTKIILEIASKCSWKSFLRKLTPHQRMFFIKNSCIDLHEFVFYFHSPIEVKKALITNFKRLDQKWERFIFSLKANSLDWLERDERVYLQEIMNEMCKEENKNKYSEIEFHVSFTTAFEKELVPKMKDEIFNVIRKFIEYQQRANILKKYVLRVSFEGADGQNLLSFLVLFEQIPNNICLLEVNLFSKEFKNIKEEIQDWKLSTQRGETMDNILNGFVKKSSKTFSSS